MPKQERAVRTRERLVLAAAEAFDRLGFASASLTAVSRSAGVSNGALHFHFENKESLAAAVAAEAARRMDAVVAAAAAATADRSALQTLVDVTHELARLLDQDVVVRAGFRLDRDVSVDLGDPLPTRWHGDAVALLERARREGALSAGVTPEDAAAVVVAVFVGFGTLARADQQWLTPGALIRFWQLLLPRIAAGPVESGQLSCTPTVRTAA